MLRILKISDPSSLKIILVQFHYMTRDLNKLSVYYVAGVTLYIGNNQLQKSRFTFYILMIIV
ncbi:hypothetical protein BLA29_010894 [Euroglyphus maynei]|uniref:Uncharacterized protein n=1 Tax=Euroglyphus maynei TaxID=6958 RepID=A0A1Y3AXH1_EURMA|nr:hypothetical protein BLA29_010894 [Euroglyphus maynei]